MKSIQNILIALTFSFLTSSCSEDDPIVSPTDGYQQLGDHVLVPNSDFYVAMYIEEGASIEVGYNKFALGLFNSAGELQSNSYLTITPMMQMTDMKHSAPFEVSEHAQGSESLQSFATVFVMSSMMGSWTLEVNVVEMNSDFEGSVAIPVMVSNPEEAKMNAIDLGDAGKLFISIVEPTAPIFGVNDFELTIHNKVSMMDWPAVENYTVEIEPEMPAMGHGSTGNENPIHVNDGHYLGKVSFSMTGEWVVHVTIKDQDVEIATTDFTIIL